MKSVKCPNCGNEIVVDESSQYLSCGSCGKCYVNPYYVEKKSADTVDTESTSFDSDKSEYANAVLRCASCSATLPSDDSSPTLTCPVCGRNHKNPFYKPSQPNIVQDDTTKTATNVQENTKQNDKDDTRVISWAYCPQCGNSLDLKNGRTEAYCDHCKKNFVVKRTQDGIIHLEEKKQTVNVQQNIVNIQQNIVTAPAKVGESKFTGTYGSLLGNRIVNSLISIFTLGFGIPWVICRSYRWEVDHTVIDGRRLKFDGTGGKLIGAWIKWMFLTLITCGIYGLWVPLKKRAWIVEHSHIEGLAGESKFTGGLASFLGLQIVNFFILVFTLGLGVPWVVCRSMKWDSEHQVIDGRRIYFDGNAAQLFGNWIKWILLTIVTFGIYSVVVPIRKQAWIVKHQSFVKPVGNNGQSVGNSGKPMSNSRKLTDDSNQRKKTGKIVGCVIAVVVVAAIIVACVLCIPPSTTWYTSEGFAYSVEIIDGTCFIRGIKDRTQTDIVIPEEIDGYKVTKIYDNAFRDCTSLTSIVIPDSVTVIFPHAFDGCTNIVEATIPASCADCIPPDSLKTVVITSGTEIGWFAFAWCDSLTSITIPDGVTTIGACAFLNCSSLTSIEIPDSVTTIESSAFEGCSSLTSVTFGENSQLSSIEDEAFYGCSSLTSIEIPDSVTTIGADAFLGCHSLTNVYYTGDIAGWCGISFVNVYANPMVYADNLYIDGKLVKGELVIPDEVTSIPAYAFRGQAITRITIPDSVTTIGSSAFYNCDSLTSVTIGDSVTTIGGNAFQACDSLTSVTFGENSQLTTIGSDAFQACVSLTSIVIPDSVTTIGDSAFYYCTRLTSITLPDSVTTIGDYAFYYCTSLTDVYFTGTEKEWNSITIGIDNDPLTNATIHYNYVNE